MIGVFSRRYPGIGAFLGEPTEPGFAAIPGSWLVIALAVGVVVEALLMRHAGLRIDPIARGDVPFYLGAMAAAGLCIALRRRATRLQQVVRDTAEYFGAFTMIGLVGAVASYPVSATTHGFVDAALQRADLAMGFDWLAWYRMVAAHPVLQDAGRIAYDSIYWSACATMAGFAVTGRQDRGRAFIVALLISAVLTLALFHFMPAVGPFAYLWRGPPPYMPESELWQPLLIPELRSHAVGLVDLAALRGLVSAPSFHAAAAVIFIAGAWPMRWLRWPMVALNAAMLLSTPVEGTHYLSDIILGAGVAGVSLLLAHWLAVAVRAIEK
ncbi:MAG: phosphatase PAP2 family protein [Pseudomonadota bacterium]|nr:phosphatase PAP2 family protein [Pseudomonadota bacterium]